MVDNLSMNETLEQQVDWCREPNEVGTAPELRVWQRRRLIMKVALFFVCFMGVGLVLFLLD